MSVVFLVLPLALVIATGAIFAFAWALRSGQLDDLETPSIRLLLDEDDESET